MTSPSVTYTLTNGSIADATAVQTNFNDLIASLSDGTKDLSISALTCAGSATFAGNVTLGNATADDITVTGSIASSVPVKTTNTYNLGATSLRWANIYSVLLNISGATTLSSTLAVTGAATLSSTLAVTGAATFNGDVTLGNATSDDITVTGRLAASLVPKTDDTYDLGTSALRYRVAYTDEINFGQDSLGHYEEDTFTAAMTDDVSVGNATTYGTVTILATRIGNMVFCQATIPTVDATAASRWVGTIPAATFTGNFAPLNSNAGSGSGFRPQSASDTAVCRFRTITATDYVQFDAAGNSSSASVTWVFHFSYLAA